MKIYWDALLRPTSGRVGRWAWTLAIALSALFNLWVLLLRVFDPEVGLWWLLNASSVCWLLFFWCYFMMGAWMREDEERRSSNEEVH